MPKLTDTSVINHLEGGGYIARKSWSDCLSVCSNGGGELELRVTNPDNVNYEPFIIHISDLLAYDWLLLFKKENKDG